MGVKKDANARYEDARSAHAELVVSYEARLADLAEDATADDVQAVIDEFEPQITEAESVVTRTKTQAEKIKSLAEARKQTEDLIPRETEERTDEQIVVGREAPVYDKDNPHGASYFADLYAASARQSRDAIARLQRNSEMTSVELEKRGTPFHDAEGRAMGSTAGAGGDFLPPLYFGDLYAEFKRARRVTAKLVRNLPLAAKGNTITIPRITGGTLTAAQQDNQNVQNTDATTQILTIPVCTVAGYNDLSRQIVERSEPGLDLLIVEDLLKDYNKRVNSYVVNGTGAGGQPTGFFTQSGVNTITYSSGSPTSYGLYSKVWDAVRQITENVFEETQALVMTARRWAWLAAAVDSQNRPLVVTNGQGPFNALGLQTGKILDDATPAGWFGGIPVYVDETLPKVQGTGTNQDAILAAAFNEHILWEDPAGPRQFTFEGVTSQTAAIRVQVFGYMAFTAGRYPAATSVIVGTGLTPPTF